VVEYPLGLFLPLVDSLCYALENELNNMAVALFGVSKIRSHQKKAETEIFMLLHVEFGIIKHLFVFFSPKR